ncbi:MAG: restriction endonuclease subunit S [Alteromonadaceae bacterium]|nr:restriction endonuclease subunit S [Alteromonadaceae bacterium]
MREIPIGELVEINPRLPKNTDETENVSFIPMQSVTEEGKLVNPETRVLGETKKGFTYFERGDILLAKITPCFENGKAAHTGTLPHKIGFGSTEFHVLRPKHEWVNAKYIFYMVWNEGFRFFAEKAMKGAAGQKRVSASFIADYKIPIPFPDEPAKSLAEQQRIAAILDKANSIRDKRQQAIELADKVLRDTFLTMFGDPIINPNGWRTLYWKESVRIINGKNQKKVESDNGPYPIYGSGGEMGRAEDYLCPENSVVIGRKGNINKPLLVKEKYWNVDTAFGLVPNIDLLSHNYLFWFCKLFNFEKLNRAVTIPSLTKVDLQEIELPIPPPHIMKKFDEVVKIIDKFVHKLSSSQQKIEELVNSLSQKAFKGEL